MSKVTRQQISVRVDGELLSEVERAQQERRTVSNVVFGPYAVKVGCGKHRLVSLRFLRKIAPQGGKARAEILTPEQRSRIAQQAAQSRWSKRRTAA
jgi:hypothetical protein